MSLRNILQNSIYLQKFDRIVTKFRSTISYQSLGKQGKTCTEVMRNDSNLFFSPWLLYILSCKKWVGRESSKEGLLPQLPTALQPGQAFVTWGNGSRALNVPGRDSSDCRARWECACSRELPPGAPASPCSMWPLSHDSSGDSLPCLPRGARLEWREKSATMGHKPVHVLGQQPGKNPTVLLFGTQDSGDTNL